MMYKYVYKYVDNLNVKEDSIEATSKDNALKALRMHNYTVISINLDVSSLLHRKLRLKFMIYFCSILEDCLNSGLGITESMSLVQRSPLKSNEKIFVDKVISGLKSGSSLSESFEKTEVFDKGILAVIAAGENSGNIDKVLHNLALYFQQKKNLINKVIQVSLYPCMTFIVVFGVVVFFSTTIIPQLADSVFSADSMSANTKFIIGCGTYLGKHVALVLLFIIGFIVSTAVLLRSPSIKNAHDKFKLTISPLKHMNKLSTELKFIQYLYILYSSGVALPLCIDCCRDIINNAYLGKTFYEAKNSLNVGKSLNVALKDFIFLDSITLSKLRIAEESGTLDNSLLGIQRSLQQQFDEIVKKMAVLIEPVTTIILGLIIGYTVISLAAPIFSMNSLTSIK